MYEKRNEPVLSNAAFLRRMVTHSSIAVGIIGGALAIGIVGYHFLEGLDWVDALLNAAMLLGGMGPVNTLQTTAGKLFAACYALFAGLIFLVIVGVLFAPLFHRFVHHFHLELTEDDDTFKD